MLNCTVNNCYQRASNSVPVKVLCSLQNIFKSTVALYPYIDPMRQVGQAVVLLS